MSDYVSFGPPDGREQALPGDPIVRDDPAEPAAPPVAFDPTPSHMHGRPWSRLRVVGAVVAAASLAGAIASALGPAADEGKGSVPPASEVPAAADGWRWDAYHGVRVQVPSNWAYALEPVQDWCRGDSAYLPRHPYVSLGATEQSVAGAAGCQGANGDVGVKPPTKLWAAHVALDPATDVALPRTTRRHGWWVVRRPIGGVVVKAVSHDRTIADRIAASAEIIDD